MSNKCVESKSKYQNQNTEFKWTHSANWHLINNYLDLINDFRDSSKRKKDLWIKISDKFREIGYDVSHEILDKKFRNLKSTYFQVKERTPLSCKSVKWEYFKVFDEILKGDKAAAASENEQRTKNDSRLNNFQSSIYVPIELKRRRVEDSTKSANESFRSVSNETTNEDQESESVDVDANDLRNENNINEIITEDLQDNIFENEDNLNKHNIEFNLNYLQAQKLQAETRYFNNKADYFEKQSTCLEIQKKLMVMQAHKLKLEIDKMKAEQEE